MRAASMQVVRRDCRGAGGLGPPVLAARPAPSYLSGMSKAEPPPLPALSPPDPAAQIAALARRHRAANGPVMAVLARLGGHLEGQIDKLPQAVRSRIETVTSLALERALSAADLGRNAPDLGPRAAPALAAFSGAMGGAGGIATSLAELPFTVTVILHAILRAAEAEGFDTRLPQVRAEALRVLSSGGPLAEDDGINTSFLGARMTVTGPAVHQLLARIVPGFSAVLGQKLAAQAVPVLGAVTGAALNAAFLTYYREAAHVRFGLMRLSALHGAETVRAGFEAELQALKLGR